MFAGSGRCVTKRVFNLKTMEYDEVTTYFLDGKEVTKAQYKRAFPDKPIGAFGIQATWRKPVESFGAGCVPKRIKDFEAHCAKHGVPTDFTTKRGRPLFTSAAHKTKVLKALGYHDNGYYAKSTTDIEG